MTDERQPATGVDPAVDLTGITVLRVHGVSGPSPAAMLQHPHPEQVVPGRLTAFWRRPRWVLRDALPGETPVDGYPRRVEAYAWGNLTSGASSRALWLLLLPFAIVNMAAWMHPPPAPDRTPSTGPAGMRNVVWRLLALSLTATLVLTAVGIGPDLVGWQCTARPGCAAQHWYTRFLATGFWHQPSRAVAAATVAPAALLAVLWWLGRASWQRYEQARPLAPTGGDSIPLARAEFWTGRHLVGVLRSAHVGAGLAIIAVFETTPGLRGADPVGYGIGVAVLAVAVLTAAGCAVLAARAGRTAEIGTTAARRQEQAGRILVTSGIASTLAATGYALAPHRSTADGVELPGFTGTIFWLFAGQLLLVSAAAVTGWTRGAGSPRWPAPGLNGMAGPLLGLFAVSMGAGMTAGTTVRLADWFGTPGHAPLAVPEEYGWAALGFGAVLLAAAGALVVAAVRIRLRLPPETARVLAEPVYVAQRAADLPAGTPDDVVAGYDREAGRRARAVARARVIAHVTDHLGGWLAGPVAAVTAAAALAAVLLYGPLTVDTTVPAVSLAYTATTWLLGLLPFALAVTYRAAHSSAAKRHTIGIVWDLSTFWPRAVHPLAPPCYGERAVPDVTDRVRLLTRDGAVILSTHSQGTVIGLAVLFQLDDRARSRTFVLTYGSPLARLYARYWPAYLGGAVLEHALDLLPGAAPAESVAVVVPRPRPGARPDGDPAADPADPLTPRWRNLWRRTDPIGGLLFPADPDRSAQVDTQPLPDPAALVLRPGDVEPPPIRGHSDYFDEPAFRWLADRAAVRMAGILRAADRGADGQVADGRV